MSQELSSSQSAAIIDPQSTEREAKPERKIPVQAAKQELTAVAAPLVQEEKLLRDGKQHERLAQTPAASSEIAARPLSPLQIALQRSYQPRAKIHSMLFRDHALPIQSVHFTIDHYDEACEQARLREEKVEHDAKEAKRSQQRDEIAKEKLPHDEWSSALYHQRGGEGIQQPIAVTDIFKPRPKPAANPEQAEDKHEHKEEILPQHHLSTVC